MKNSIVVLLFLFVSTVHAELKLVVNQGHTNPMPIAITDFEGNSPVEKEIGIKMAKVIKNDLESTGLFSVISNDSFIEQHIPFNTIPRFQDWKIIKAQALINGFIKMAGKGSISVGTRVWDVLSESEMKDAASAFETEEKHWRRIAHIIADSIYKRLTGEEGYFDTRIIYVAESLKNGKRIRKLAIMDQDGENKKMLTNGEFAVMSPRFAPGMQKIVFMTFVDSETAKVFTLNLETGLQKLVGTFPGLTYAPRFSPDNSTIILSQALRGSSSLYTMNLQTNITHRLTHGRSIDTSPSYSPDGKQIVFNSDRSGSMQLFTMDADGSNIKRISFEGGSYATPVWSPRGDLIAFTKILKNKFYIGVMKADGSGERLITTGYLVEGPTWAPNGRTLMFWREEKPKNDNPLIPSYLYAIDITGDNERKLKTDGYATHPAWSPSLPLTIK